MAGRVTASWLGNHRSWEDPDVKAVMGQKLATFYQRALEYVPPCLPPQTVIEPLAAVAKKDLDKYRDITDAATHAKATSLVTGASGRGLFTARDLADALMPCAIESGHDVKDGYHIPVFSRCTGELVWGWRQARVPLNLDKRQRLQAAGFLYDTLRGPLLILPDKLVKLLGCLRE